MTLSALERRSLERDGYVVLPGFVGRKRVAAALGEVERALARPAPEGPRPELAASAPVQALFHATRVRPLLESLIGPLSEDLQSEVLVRFPQNPGATERTNYHIDGFEYHGGAGARDTPAHTHTAAIAVLLTDFADEACGNLSLIPGSHRALERWFREHREVPRGMPPVELGRPLHVTGRAGDVVLYHHQVAHSAFASRNLSARTGCAAVFWAKHLTHDARWREALSDLWLEWPGLSRARRPGPRRPGGRAP